MTISKIIGTGALVAVLAAAPVFALANNGGTDEFKPRSTGSTLEVIINDSGKTVVRGARVTSVSDSTITAQTLWGASSITWTVRTDGDTSFLRKTGTNAGLADVDEGDYISFSGVLSSGSSFTIDADVVKNWSLDVNNDSSDDDKDHDEKKHENNGQKKGWGNWMKDFKSRFHFWDKR